MPHSTFPSPEELGRALMSAFPADWDNDDDEVDDDDLLESAVESWESDFYRAAAECRAGQIEVDFPNSTHGDGATVDVYRLPAGTVVMLLSATYELEGPQVSILRSADLEDVVQAAYDLLGPVMGHVEQAQDLDSDKEHDPDSDCTVQGEAAIRGWWATHAAGGRQS